MLDKVSIYTLEGGMILVVPLACPFVSIIKPTPMHGESVHAFCLREAEFTDTLTRASQSISDEWERIHGTGAHRGQE